MQQKARHPASDLAVALERLLSDATSYAQANNHVLGTSKLISRVSKELRFARALSSEEQHPRPGHPSAHSDINGNSNGAKAYETLTKNRIQGLKNNLRGLRAELDVAKAAPGVVAISHPFPLRFAMQPGEAVLADGDALLPKSVEIDVVANEGHTWCEVKDLESFGIGSNRWLGCPGHLPGIKQQAQLRLRAAQLPWNFRRWRPPSLVFHFPSGIDDGVAAELRGMGVIVTGPGPLDPACLPLPPPGPTRTNLDVTACCALVSEVSNGGATCPKVHAWAQRVNVGHWQQCLEDEKRDPLLPALLAYLQPDRQLVAAESAVEQFEALMEQFGGPRERQRWRELLQRMEVVPSGAAGSSSPRVEMLPDAQSLSELHRRTLSVGDALQCTTITANVRAIQAAAAQGVFLEAKTHRAVWLTGL